LTPTISEQRLHKTKENRTVLARLFYHLSCSAK
jgi:hypothetical protein